MKRELPEHDPHLQMGRQKPARRGAQIALYALAILDLNGIMKSLNNANKLNKRVRDYVRANARRAFNDLDKELAKKSARGH